MILTSPVLTALVTVGLGGIIGSCITTSIQEGAKQRELSRLAYEKFLQEELTAVTRAYEIVGRVTSSAENLIVLTGPAYDRKKFEGDAEQDRIFLDHTKKIRDEYVDHEARWRQNRETLGFLMSLYHREEPRIYAAWQDLEQAVSSYIICARLWYLEHYPGPHDITGVCSNERQVLRNQFEHLNDLLKSSRRDPWEGVPP